MDQLRTPDGRYTFDSRGKNNPTASTVPISDMTSSITGSIISVEEQHAVFQQAVRSPVKPVKPLFLRHVGTKISIVLAQLESSGLPYEKHEQLVTQLWGEAEVAGLDDVPADPTQVEAWFNATEMDVTFAELDNEAVRAACLSRLTKLRTAWEKDHNVITQAHMHVWEHLSGVSEAAARRKTRMNPKVIGVDLDGVVYDAVGEFNDWMVRQRGKEQPDEELTEYNLPRYWGISGREVGEVFTEAVKTGHMFRYGKPLRDGVRGVQKLYEEGHTIVIITARDIPGIETECYANTIRWLREQGIPYDSLHLSSSKEEIDFDILIDDAPKNVENMHVRGKTATLLSRRFNRGEAKGYSCREWPDIMKEFCVPEEDETLFTVEPELSKHARDATIPLGNRDHGLGASNALTA